MQPRQYQPQEYIKDKKTLVIYYSVMIGPESVLRLRIIHDMKCYNRELYKQSEVELSKLLEISDTSSKDTSNESQEKSKYPYSLSMSLFGKSFNNCRL